MRLTGLESNSSSKGEVSSTSSNQESNVQNSHSKSKAKLSISSLNSSSSPTKSSPKTPQLQSINYYESYFDDSYIGEFTGEVPSDAKLDSNEAEQDWPNVSEINSTSGAVEFTYDSFGPESIVFPNGSEEAIIEDINGKNEEVIINSDENGDQENSPGKSEAEDKCDDVLPNPANFKRNSTLTTSQRRKLSPQINFTDIMNASDEISSSVIPPQTEDIICDKLKNEQNSNDKTSPELEITANDARLIEG